MVSKVRASWRESQSDMQNPLCRPIIIIRTLFHAASTSSGMESASGEVTEDGA